MEMLTRTEKEKLEGRLAALKANRPVISKRIGEAKELGDLKENGDYHAAKEQQGMEEAEIRRMEDRLKHAHIVEEGKSSDFVFLGSMVKIKDVEKGRIDMVKLVGELSGDAPEDFDEVTANSPMGEALMKARPGDVVRVNTPRGVKRFEVVEIA